MPKSRHYTPQLDRELVSQLYHAAQLRRIPMTRLTSALVREGLVRLQSTADEPAIVREEPPAPDPGGRPE
jgi:hypothetical protein